MKNLFQEFLSAFKITVVVSVLLFSANYLFAWAGPGYTTVGSTPPNDNVPAPINASNFIQNKQGTLGVGGLGVFGGFLLQDGTQGTGKVLTSLDANGNAAWSDVYFSQRLRLPSNTTNTLPNDHTSLTQNLGSHSVCGLVENAVFVDQGDVFDNGDSVACTVSFKSSDNTWSVNTLRDSYNSADYVSCRAACLGGGPITATPTYDTYPQPYKDIVFPPTVYTYVPPPEPPCGGYTGRICP